MKCIGHRTVAAACVEDLLTNLSLDYRSITIINLGSFADYSVLIVIDTSSDVTVETVARNYLGKLTIIL